MREKFFLGVLALFLLVVVSGCAGTYNFDKIVLKNQKTLFNKTLQKQGEPMIVVVKRKVRECFHPWFSNNVCELAGNKTEATGEMIIPYLKEKLPYARFVVRENEQNQNDQNSSLEGKKVTLMLVKAYMRGLPGFGAARFNTHIAYKVILPNGEEKEFETEATRLNWVTATRTFRWTLNRCLTSLADQITEYLLQKGVVKPDQVKLATK